jgi:hypothetical protein
MEYLSHHQAAYRSHLPEACLQTSSSLLHLVVSNLRLTFLLLANLVIRKGKDRGLSRTSDMKNCEGWLKLFVAFRGMELGRDKSSHKAMLGWIHSERYGEDK